VEEPSGLLLWSTPSPLFCLLVDTVHFLRYLSKLIPFD
jgi:hypothetical protein